MNASPARLLGDYMEDEVDRLRAENQKLLEENALLWAERARYRALDRCHQCGATRLDEAAHVRMGGHAFVEKPE